MNKFWTEDEDSTIVAGMAEFSHLQPVKKNVFDAISTKYFSSPIPGASTRSSDAIRNRYKRLAAGVKLEKEQGPSYSAFLTQATPKIWTEEVEEPTSLSLHVLSLLATPKMEKEDEEPAQLVRESIDCLKRLAPFAEELQKRTQVLGEWVEHAVEKD
jgi:hypothetical protein